MLTKKDDMGSDKKQILFDLLRTAEEKSSEAEKVGQSLVKNARFSRDLAGCVRDVIEVLSRDDLLAAEEWDRSIATWEGLCRGMTVAADQQTYVGSLTATVSGTGLTMSSVFQTMIVRPISPQPSIAVGRFYDTIKQDDFADEIRAGMMRLGLDRRGGDKRAATELLEDSRAAIDSPGKGEGSPVAILIPLRECINTVITELLRRRPTQEPASKTSDKISSVGRQCSRSGLFPAFFAGLGEDAELFLNELSGAKQTAMTRDKLQQQFRRGLLLLKTLIESVDEAKLRR